MNYVLNAGEMKQADANTMGHYGMLSAVLMERAALGVFEEIERRFPDAEHTSVLIACGAGNNGGDGFALARLLFLKGYEVTILFAGREEKCTEETRRQMEIARRYGVPMAAELPDRSYDILADALFGIGLCRAIEGSYRALIEEMNGRDAYRIAVDIASGVSADSGAVLGTAFRADLTVTFGFAKCGQLLYPGADYSGEVTVKDIGIDPFSLLDTIPAVRMPERKDLCLLPERRSDSNKGSYGRVLIFAGSKNMAGAAAFAARSAYAAGAGLVRIVTAEENRTVLQTLVPEAILTSYTEKTDPDALVRSLLSWGTAVVAGPGLGTSDWARDLLETLLRAVTVPCVLDADALNLLAANQMPLDGGKAPLILTPHVGEMSRLTGMSITKIKEDPIHVTAAFASSKKAIVVLKDARTVSALPDRTAFLNVYGNHGMATGGSGDVLSGIIGGLLAQGCSAKTAAPIGVLLHALAGDAAADRVGRRSLTATDLIDGIREVLRKYEGE